MNNKILIPALVLMVMLSVSNISNAQEEECIKKSDCQEMKFPDRPHRPEFKKHHPSSAEMKAKKAEFEQRLNLTDEQKAIIEQNRKKDIEKIKPIMKKLHQKRKEMIKIQNDASLSPEQKEKKINNIKKDMQKLKVQANKYREENMKNFESILDENQKQEFEKIKLEQKQKMEERKKQFEEMKKNKDKRTIDEPKQ